MGFQGRTGMKVRVLGSALEVRRQQDLESRGDASGDEDMGCQGVTDVCKGAGEKEELGAGDLSKLVTR